MSAISTGSDIRRRSSLFAPSRQEIAATSQVDHSDAPEASRAKRPHTPYENTYRMDYPKQFHVKAVEDIINSVLAEQLEEEDYDPRASKQLSKTLTTIITNRVKTLNFERYKIVTIVTVGQIADQGLRVASRCLMDQEKDGFASGSYKNSSLYGVATVYGFFYE